jgi:hypothetical protein
MEGKREVERREGTGVFLLGREQEGREREGEGGRKEGDPLSFVPLSFRLTPPRRIHPLSPPLALIPPRSRSWPCCLLPSPSPKKQEAYRSQ